MKSKKTFKKLTEYFKCEYTQFFKELVITTLKEKGESNETYNYIINQLLSQFNDVVPNKVQQFKQIEL